MLFNSPIFLFLFLPLFLSVYYLIPLVYKNRSTALSWRNAWLFASSLLFYAWGEGPMVGVLLLSIVTNYTAGLLIAGGHRQTGLWLSLTGSLSLLFYYKYANFAVETAQHLIGWPGSWANTGLVLLPIGISFYTFQGISYVLDVYWGRIGVNRNFIAYGTYTAMFPHQIAGPIVRYADIAPELSERNLSVSRLVSGIERFILGLAKKMLLANTFAEVADTLFNAPVGSITVAAAWLGIVAYTLQIYFDFSGYSDMAIGLGRLIGFDFKENFNYPYTARSIQDFWRRWHISLSSWFRDYVYVPLGGSRGSTTRTYRNLLIVFFITGLWHGASWNFIIWGLFHGAFLLAERAGLGHRLKQWPAVIGHSYTVLVVLIGWVLFRASDIGAAIAYLGRLIGLNGSETNSYVYTIHHFTSTTILGTFILGALFTTPVHLIAQRYRNQTSNGVFQEIGYVVGLLCLFFLSMMSLAASTYNPFIYFRF
ncbi:MBOAT family O-acyltransferase [Fibrella forsythiae]|uniref:MBOAT family protein n=1 Tax=Fibrella forsythiae TaxID=2817061 RepID=A0ABS3JEW8_9BACT|nr:MBOAT family O-acyltransferase [Fibrella forsythiae]MBO0948546.1 MBOAT family protein [Fibrella forsythiae]